MCDIGFVAVDSIDNLGIGGIDERKRKIDGWMLKAASEAHQKDIFDFVIRNKAAMSRTALRYAIEKMPPEMKAEAMKK